MSEDTSSDIAELLERHRQGDPAARQALLDRAHRRLVKIAAAMLNREFPHFRGRRDVDSVVDEAWMGLMRALETARPASEHEFFGLVLIKVRQTLQQMARRERRHERRRADVAGPIAAVPGDAFDAPDTTNDPGRLAILSELHRQIALLPPSEKQVFELYYYNGLTQVEAAAILGLHPKRVSRLWLQATSRLAEWLGDAEGLR